MYATSCYHTIHWLTGSLATVVALALAPTTAAAVPAPAVQVLAGAVLVIRIVRADLR